MKLKAFLQLESDLEEDKLQEVLTSLKRRNAFKEVRDIIILLASHLKSIDNELKSHSIYFENAVIERNKIKKATLDVINQVKRKYITEAEEDFYIAQKKVNVIIEQAENLYSEIQKRGEDGYEWLNEMELDLRKIMKIWKEQRFSVAVIALMKSGKSTLLNAWIGNEYLPTNVKPETMRVIRIRHNQKIIDGGILKQGPKVLARNVEDIYTKIQELNDLARNHNDSSKDLTLTLSLPALKDEEISDVKFELLDTPGVNEAGVQFLEDKVNKILKDADVIIYLLDISKLKSGDEEEIFDKLKGLRKDLFSNLKTKLFFVVNKIDLLEKRNLRKEKKFNTPADVKAYINEYLKSNFDLELDENELFLISAEKAILGRLILSGQADDYQKKDFYSMVFGTSGQTIDESLVIANAKRIIEESGIQNLEKGVLNKIHKQRLEIFITAVLYKLEKHFQQVRRNIEVSKGSLAKEEIQIEKLKEDIETINTGLSQLNEVNNKFKKKGDESISSFLKSFKSTTTKIISKVFSGEENKNSTVDMPFSVVIAFLKLIYLSYTNEDKKKIEIKIQELHNKVMVSLESHLHVLWEEVVFYIHYYHLEQVKSINEIVNPLIKEIERRINRELNIELLPNEMDFPPIDLKEFYKKIDQGVLNLIVDKDKFSPHVIEETKIANRDVKFFHWNLRSKGKEYKVRKFKLYKKDYYFSPLDYRRYIINEIENLSSNTEKIAKEAVQVELDKFKAQIEDKVISYANKYIIIIEDEIRRKNGGGDIKKRKELVLEDGNVIDEILDKIEEVK